MSTLRSKLLIPAVLAAGVAASLLVGLSFAPTFAGFNASISNNNNKFGTGVIKMSETQGATTCLSSAAGTVTQANTGTCDTINKLNGTTVALPGVSYTSTVTIKNEGTVPANTFTLTPVGCAQSTNGTQNGTATNLCSKVNLTISDDTNTKCVYPAAASACAAPSNTYNLTALGTTPINLAVPLAAGASRTYTFTVQLDSSAGNDYQGLLATETLNWAFAA